MTQPTLIYSQPVMRPPNPFGPVSGAQVGVELDYKVLATNRLSTRTSFNSMFGYVMH